MVSFDLEVLHHILHTFIHLKGDFQFALIVVGYRGRDSGLAVTGVLVDGFQVLDALVQELLAVFSVGEEVSLGNGHVGEQVIVGKIMVSADRQRIYLSLLALFNHVNNRGSRGVAVHAAGDIGIEEPLGLVVGSQVVR